MASQSSCHGSMGRIGPEGHLWVRELSDQGREPCVTTALPGWEARQGMTNRQPRKRFPGRWSPGASQMCLGWEGNQLLGGLRLLLCMSPNEMHQVPGRTS